MSYRTDNRWSTKADILQDLAEVTGRFIDVDEEFIVAGEEPPPVRRFDEDDELNLRFSGANGPYDIPRETMAPDLEGIQKMLRMVEEYNETTENVIRSPEKQEDSLITISKLNPDVPEFVPKGAIEASPRIKKNVEVRDSNSKNDDETSNEEKPVKNDSNNDNCITIDKKLDVSKLNADQIKDISIKLRKKICDVSKKDDLHTKKEKNVAIAALLKLYTAQTDNNVKEPIKLITPDYFATCPAETEIKSETNNVAVNLINTEKISEDIGSLSENSTDKSQTTSSLADDTSTQSGETSSKCNMKIPTATDHFPHDPNIQKSIKKVTSWLQKPVSTKPKGPVVCMGPISFKKKSVTSSASDESSTISSSSLNVTTNQIGHFVPSKRAEDLSKKYSERGKAIEKQSEDIWTPVIRKMKAIDKKKLEKSTSQSDSREDVGSRGSTS